jgi:parallel beta-helix repeat protein
MPKRIAFGTNLTLFTRRLARMAQRAARRRAAQFGASVAVDSLESRRLMSATYFVATWGSDSGPGTSAKPFKTIQEAANVANSGDVVDIFGGTYRETVHPAHSGVTFTNYEGQSVTVSGADLVTGWSNTGAATYSAPVSWNLGSGNNQVFVDGKMVNESRWPNTGPDLLHPTLATIGSYSNGIIYDNAVTQPNGYWTGATITVAPGPQWLDYTGVVTNSGPGWLKVSLPSMSSSEQPVAGNPFFLSEFTALDGPNQWYRDSSGVLHLWDAQGDNPSAHTVEVKRREYAFDLTGVANTTIQGINIFAATINTNWASTNTTINAINATYISQFNNVWGSGWSPPAASGIMLAGAGSIIENSTIAYSAGDGVAVGAANIRVTNNIIHDVDYSGTDAAGVRDAGNNTQIDNNTIYNTGRDGINFQASNVTVTSNTIHDSLLLTEDGAAIYTVNNTGGGTIAYNTVYNVTPTFNAKGGLYGGAGIFLDNNSANLSVHDNVIANVDCGISLNFTSRNEHVYNNKIGAIYYSVGANNQVAYCDWSGSQWYDNVYYNPNLLTGVDYSQWGNSFASGSPALPASTTKLTTPPPATVPASPPAAPKSPPAGPVSPPAAPASPPVTKTPAAPPKASATPSSKTTAPASATPTSIPATSTTGAISAAFSASGKPAVLTPAISTATKAEALIAKLSKGVKSAPKSSIANVASQLAGTIAGTYTVKPARKNAVAGVTLKGKGFLPAFNSVTLSGKSVGALSSGAATGTLQLIGPKGQIILTLTAAAPLSGSAIPTNFAYVITSGTGAFKRATGTGIVNLVLTPAKKKNLPGTFSLVLQPR